jgi:o-succinylbenzoate synthase
MRITGIRMTQYRVPFRAPYVTAAGTVSHRDGIIIQMETNEGLSGLGEGSLLPHHAAGTEALADRILALARGLAGRELEDFFTLDGHEAAVDAEAWAPLSIAAWDLAGRMHGIPVARLLNPSSSRSVAVNALIGGGSIEALEGSARAARDAGYRAVKLKVGFLPALEAERERVAACRRALGPEVRLRLDANGAWTVDEAVEALSSLAAHGIEYVEQPLPPGQLEALHGLREAVPVRIAADEDITDLASAALVLKTEAADLLVVKPLQCGGIVLACMITTAATAAGAGVTFTTSIDTGIGTAAALQLAAANGTGGAHGLATLTLLEDDLVLDPSLTIENGLMRVPDAPGLGIALDHEALTRYSVASWEVCA